jgi:hypothetical protein
VNKYRDSWGITIANISNGSRANGIINYLTKTEEWMQVLGANKNKEITEE